MPAQKLADLLRNPESPLRLELIAALGVWGTADEVPLMIMIADADLQGEGAHAISALIKMKDERAIPLFMRSLRKEFLRSHAINGLRSFGATAEPEVLRLLDQANDPLRRVGIDLLKDIGTQKSVPALEKFANGMISGHKDPAKDALLAIQARSKK